MDAKSFLKKYVFGQEEIKYELSLIMEEMKLGKNLNLMLTGPSGWGKSHIAKVIYNYVGIEKSITYIGDAIEDFRKDKRIQVLDEAHELKSPEFLYNYMDCNEYCFIILTNEYDLLKEPLVNRCIIFSLRGYKDLDLAKMISRTFKIKQLSVPYIMSIHIAGFCRGNPREAKILAKRLSIIFDREGTPDGLNELDKILSKMRIYEGGFTDLDLRYLEFLRENKIASINTLAEVLNIPKYVLMKDIEPFLIKKKLIEITSRGRKIKNG